MALFFHKPLFSAAYLFPWDFRGVQLPMPRHALLLGPAAEDQLHRARIDFYLLPEPKRGRQEPGQPGDVDAAAEFMPLMHQRRDRRQRRRVVAVGSR